MRNQTLKDIYSGSLIPAERQIVKDSEMSAAIDELVKAEEISVKETIRTGPRKKGAKN